MGKRTRRKSSSTARMAGGIATTGAVAWVTMFASATPAAAHHTFYWNNDTLLPGETLHDYDLPLESPEGQFKFGFHQLPPDPLPPRYDPNSYTGSSPLEHYGWNEQTFLQKDTFFSVGNGGREVNHRLNMQPDGDLVLMENKKDEKGIHRDEPVWRSDTGNAPDNSRWLQIDDTGRVAIYGRDIQALLEERTDPATVETFLVKEISAPPPGYELHPTREQMQEYWRQRDQDEAAVERNKAGKVDEDGFYIPRWDEIDPNRVVAEVFNALDDEDGIIEGVPESEPGTTDANGVYTVRWEDVAPDPAAAAVAVEPASGDMPKLPSTQLGTTCEHMYVISCSYGPPVVPTYDCSPVAPWKPLHCGSQRDPAEGTLSTDPPPDAAIVASIFSRTPHTDGILYGQPESEPGTTDADGVYTVAWEDIAAQVEAETGFRAQSDAVAADVVDEVVVTDAEGYGEPAAEPGTIDDEGVYTVAWEDIAADVEAETGFTAQSDEVVHEEGIVYGEPASEPGTTDEEGVYTVTWEEIDPAQAVTEVFAAEPDADGIIHGEPIVEESLPVGEDMIGAVVAAAAAAETTSSLDG